MTALLARQALALAAALALGGCTSLHAPIPNPTPADALPPLATAPSLASDTAGASAITSLQGQLSLKLGALGEQAARGLSLGFFFTGNDHSGQLDLMTLMGSQVAQVGWQGPQAWLDDGQGRRSFSSLDELSLQALGEPLPLKALSHWMQGQPDPTLPSQAGAQPGQFEQLGWAIDARELAQKRLQAQRPGQAGQRAVQLKVYLDR